MDSYHPDFASPESAQQAIREHLSKCPECCAYVAGMIDAYALLAGQLHDWTQEAFYIEEEKRGLQEAMHACLSRQSQLVKVVQGMDIRQPCCGKSDSSIQE